MKRKNKKNYIISFLLVNKRVNISICLNCERITLHIHPNVNPLVPPYMLYQFNYTTNSKISSILNQMGIFLDSNLRDFKL